MRLRPYVDPREDGGVPLTRKQIRNACRDDQHVVSTAALYRPGQYACVYCDASVEVEMPLIEAVV